MNYRELPIVVENLEKKNDSCVLYFHGFFQKKCLNAELHTNEFSYLQEYSIKPICYKQYFSSIKDCINRKCNILKNKTKYKNMYINCSYIRNIWFERNNNYYLTKIILVYAIKKDETL